jgi:hypothetical protein
VKKRVLTWTGKTVSQQRYRAGNEVAGGKNLIWKKKSVKGHQDT